MTATAARAPRPDDGEEMALWRRLKAEGDGAAREALFNRHIRFAVNIARRHARDNPGGDIEIGDLRQLACAGLLEAVDRYDLAHGVPFRPFAAHRISGSIRDGIARMSEMREQISWRHRMRRERLRSIAGKQGRTRSSLSEAMADMAEIAMGLALGFLLEDGSLYLAEGEESPSPTPSGYESAAWQELLAALQDALAKLGTRDQMILRRHYIEGIAFDALARLMGVSKGRVSQLHRSALAQLRGQLAARGHFRLEK